MPLLETLSAKPYTKARIVTACIIIFEAILLWVLPKAFETIFPKDLRWSEFPIAFISLINSTLAFFFSYQAFSSYDPPDLQRKVWRFVMISMAVLLLGHFTSIIMRFGFRVNMAHPPTWPDWFGYIWFLPALLIALIREYNLVRTRTKPNRIMSIGLPTTLTIFTLVLLLISPLFTARIIGVTERIVALWFVGFSFAILLVAIALMSEIYSGLLSMSWKIIIIAVFVFCLYYALFYFIGANLLEAGRPWLKIIQPLLSQLGTILIAMASYIEIHIIS